MRGSQRSRRHSPTRRRSSNSSYDSFGTRCINAIANKYCVKEEEFPSFWVLALTTSLLLAPVSIKNYDIPSIMDDHFIDSDAPYFFKIRPIGVRWRDEATLARIAYNYTQRMEMREVTMMPLMTERPHTHVHISGQLLPTTSSAPSAEIHDSPSIEDIELIDVLWRSDIASEKGTRQLEPAEQYERDLQLLTEKSVHAQLSAEESSRYEDLSKVYFEDFYVASNLLCCGLKGQPQSALRSDSFKCEDEQVEKRTLSTPTDDDLAALLDDVSKEGGQLNRLTCSGPHPPPSNSDTLPLMNNVSLSEGIVFTAQNVTEMSIMQHHQQTAMAAILSSPTPSTLYNETSSPSFWMQQAEITPSDIYPNNGFISFQNDTEVEVISTGSQYDHQYHAILCQEYRDERTPMQLHAVFDPYYSARTTSLSNESSSVCSSYSVSATASPHYHSEIEKYNIQGSRYFGKLVPREVDEVAAHPRVCRSDEDNGAVVVASARATARRRGRQSKDEQLAAANQLPLSAREISEMTLGELHRALKNLNLTEHQRQLIRKIRRRGKNKVAARTCRERRGERQRYTHGAELLWRKMTHAPESSC